MADFLEKAKDVLRTEANAVLAAIGALTAILTDCTLSIEKSA